MLNPNHSPNPIDKRAIQVAHARVGTWLTPRERGGVDVAAGSQLTVTHRDTLQALRHDLITARIDTALVSAALVRRSDVPALSALIQDFPGTPTVGLVSEIEEARALAGALAFGQAGIHRLVDVRNVAGWSALRSAFDPERLRDPFFRKALRELTGKQNETDRPGCCTSGWARFLEASFSPRIVTAKKVATSLGVPSSTLTSRFFRAGLPSPKQYVARARLVWAAHLGESPGLSINAIAQRMDASSPQSFGRMVRILLGVTAAEFRRRFDGAAMLTQFRADMIDPYWDIFRTFDPITASQAERANARHSHRSALPEAYVSGSAA